MNKCNSYEHLINIITLIYVNYYFIMHLGLVLKKKKCCGIISYVYEMTYFRMHYEKW